MKQKRKFNPSNLKPAYFSLGMVIALSNVSAAVSQPEFATGDSNGEPPTPQNEVNLSIAYPEKLSPTQNNIFQDHYGFDDTVSANLDSLHWESSGDGDWKWILDSYYLDSPKRSFLKLEGFKEEKLSFKIKWNRNTEWDSPYGIWFPSNDLWITAGNSNFKRTLNHLDLRFNYQTGNEWIIALKYNLRSKKGDEKSNIYGTGGPSTLYGRKGVGIIPSKNTVDNTTHTVDLSLKKTLDNDRKVLVRSIVQTTTNENQLNTERSASTPSIARKVTQKSDSDNDWISTNAQTEKRINDKWLYTGSIAYARFNGSLSGSRIYGTQADPVYDIDLNVRQLNDAGFTDLVSDQNIDQWTFNLNLLYTPTPKWRVLTSIQFKDLSQNAFSSYTGTNDIIDWQLQQRIDEESLVSASQDQSIEEILSTIEARYSGFKKANLYWIASYGKDNGSLAENWNKERIVPVAQDEINLLDRNTAFSRDSLKLKTGVSYSASSQFRLHLQAYWKQKKNNFDLNSVTLVQGDFTDYPGFIKQQDTKTKDINLRVHWRIHRSLLSVTRLDFQESTLNSATEETNLLESSQHDRFIWSQSITWTPTPRLFLQLTGLMVEDEVSTKASEITGFFQDTVRTVPSNYKQASINAYWIITSWLDLETNYTILDLNNFQDNSPTSVAYGEDFTDQYLQLIAHFHLENQVKIDIGITHYDYSSQSSSNLLDYKSNIVFTRLKWIF